jgi:hypothetical protein
LFSGSKNTTRNCFGLPLRHIIGPTVVGIRAFGLVGLKEWIIFERMLRKLNLSKTTNWLIKLSPANMEKLAQIQ